MNIVWAGLTYDVNTPLYRKVYYKIPVKGIIINNFDAEGYPVEELKRDIEKLTGNKVLGVIPKLESLDANDVADVLSKQVNISELLEN